MFYLFILIFVRKHTIIYTISRLSIAWHKILKKEDILVIAGVILFVSDPEVDQLYCMESNSSY